MKVKGMEIENVISLKGLEASNPDRYADLNSKASFEIFQFEKDDVLEFPKNMTSPQVKAFEINGVSVDSIGFYVFHTRNGKQTVRFISAQNFRMRSNPAVTAEDGSSFKRIPLHVSQGFHEGSLYNLAEKLSGKKLVVKNHVDLYVPERFEEQVDEATGKMKNVAVGVKFKECCVFEIIGESSLKDAESKTLRGE